MNKLKVLMVIFMGVISVWIMRENYYAHVAATNVVYGDIHFTGLAMEIQQYTRQIEYGLKNGKSLDSFYKIESVLLNIKKCSSYINGVYILNSDLIPKYSYSDDNCVLPSSIRLPDKGAIYGLHREGQSYIMALSIYGRSDKPEGYLLLDLSDTVITNSVAQMHSDSLIQTIVIGVLSFLLGTVFVIHFCRKRETVLYSCAKVMSLSLCAGIIIDAALSVIKFFIMLESLIQHSVSNIVMVMQNNLDTIVEKGVSINRIYDLNSWLLNSSKSVPYIENFIYDKSYKISAIPNEDKTIFVFTYIVTMILTIAILVLALLAICIIFRIICKVSSKLKQRRLRSSAGAVKAADLSRQNMTENPDFQHLT